MSLRIASAVLALGASFATPVVAQTAESKYAKQVQGSTKVIVFVHGVVGDTASTWSNSTSNAYWPKLVAGDPAFERANVYVFGYPSAPLGRSFSVNELAEAMRLRLQADGVLDHPELVFLSHSMGGLVTRAFLLKYREQAAKVKMAYFFATPTEGSPYARLVSLASANPQFKNMFPMKSDDALADLQRDWLAAKLGIRSFCAYEGKTTYGALIVDQRSASNLCTEPLDPIAEDHIQIVKPVGINSDAYIAFKNAYRAAARDGGVVPHSDRSKIDHPTIDPEQSVETQVRLFPEDKVRIYAPESLKRVRLGGDWETYSVGRTYMVIGTPGRPVVPAFDPMPAKSFKIEVEYNKYVELARDLRGGEHGGGVIKR